MNMLNMVFLFIGLISVAVILFLVIKEICETKRIRASKRRRLNNETQMIPTVCAGHVTENVNAEERVVSLKYNTFKDENGDNLNVDDYNAYVVAGNSMQFCDIKEGDLLLATKSVDEKDLTELPSVIVLSAPNKDATLSQFKLRRAWRICSDKLSNEDYFQILSEVLQLDTFKQLKSELANIGICQTDDELINDFFNVRGSLDRYRTKYSSVAPQKIVISTTYDTKEEKIHFSIHNVLEMVGIKKYVYDISNV